MGVSPEFVYAAEFARILKRRAKVGFVNGPTIAADTDASTVATSQPGRSPSGPGATPSLSDDTQTACPDPQSPHSPVDADRDLIGLTLSGGGLRSAAFNLGLIQALHQFGVLRFIDYLSMVSGGAYIGAAVCNSFKKNTEYNRDNFEFADRTGAQPPRVARLLENGNYLIRLDLLANKYALGFVLNLIPLVSLLIAIGAGLAFLWRLLDSDYLRDRLAGLGFEDDFAPALLPGVLAIGIWFIVALCAVARFPFAKWCRPLLATAVACLSIGGAILIGNGDISWHDAGGHTVSTTGHWILEPGLLILVGIGLLPFLRPSKLFRSGTTPQPHLLQSWIFYYASFAMLIGLPLAIVCYLGRENVSGYARARTPHLDRGDVIDPTLFSNWLFAPQRTVLLAAGTTFELNTAMLPTLDHRVGQQTNGPLEAMKRPAANTFKSALFAERARLRLLGPDSWEIQAPVDGPKAVCFPCDNDNRLEALVDDTLKAKMERMASYEALSRREHQKVVKPHWWEWRYLRFLDRWRNFIGYVFLDRQENAYNDFISGNEDVRNRMNALLWEFNARILPQRHLFEVTVLPDTAATEGGTPAPRPKEGISSIGEPSKLAIIPPRLQTLLSTRNDVGIEGMASADVVELNRLLLEGLLPGMIRSRDDIQRVTVIRRDQLHRALLFALGVSVFLICGFFTNPNRTSLHEYYRDRLSQAFLQEPVPDASTAPTSASLTDCTSDENGFAYPLIGASVCDYLPWQHASQLHPRFRRCVLTPTVCGSVDHPWGDHNSEFVPTSELAAGNELTLADAMAISGAAVTPTYFVHHIVNVLMSVLNLRTGKWLPNPACEHNASECQDEKHSDNPPHGAARRGVRRPRLIGTMLSELPWLKTRRFVLVTDGGHSDNLGLGALLDRQCRLIIVSDASHDPKMQCRDFAQIVREYRQRYGIEFFDLDKTTPFGGDVRFAFEQSRTNGKVDRYRFGVIRYPAPDATHSHDSLATPSWGFLIYIKPHLRGSEPVDVLSYHSVHPEFPNESTADQSYDEAQFEAYRELGYSTGRSLCRNVSPDQLWRATDFDVPKLWRSLSGSTGPGNDSDQTNTILPISQIEVLVDALRAGHEPARSDALHTLSELPAMAFLAGAVLLLRNARGTHVEVAQVATSILREIDQEALKRQLITVFLDHAALMADRIFAAQEVRALMIERDSLFDEKSLQSLCSEALHSTNAQIRARAVDLLGLHQGSSEIIKGALETIASHDRSERVKRVARALLSKHGGEPAK